MIVISLSLLCVACTHNPSPIPYSGMFYADRYFVDERELFDTEYSGAHVTRKDIPDRIYHPIDFEYTDNIKLIFDPLRYVIDDTGRIPGNDKLYYSRGSRAHEVTIEMNLDKVEVVELLDLQARSGCLDLQPHPTNIAVTRLDPNANIQAITLRIKMPCRRYYSVPDVPYESLLMVKVKTVDGFYYTVHKLYSAADECLQLGCSEAYGDSGP